MYGTMYGNMARMLKTTVYLPDGLKDRVEQLAERTGRSEAEVIRTALEEYVGEHAARPQIPLFAKGEVAPIEDWDEALRGFGEE